MIHITDEGELKIDGRTEDIMKQTSVIFVEVCFALAKQLDKSPHDVMQDTLDFIEPLFSNKIDLTNDEKPGDILNDKISTSVAKEDR